MEGTKGGNRRFWIKLMFALPCITARMFLKKQIRFTKDYKGAEEGCKIDIPGQLRRCSIESVISEGDVWGIRGLSYPRT